MHLAVIGLGGTGSATARFLAGAGHDVTAFEQFQLGHTRGSSHGESRIIRYTYPDAFHTRMMAEAYPLWAELQAQAGEELFVRCGGLLLGPPDHRDLLGTKTALEGAGLRYEILSPTEAARRFPAVHLGDGEVALFQEGSGFLRSTSCVLANARLAREAGAELRVNTAVEEIRQEGQKVVVTTAGGEERFDRAVVTAGAWMGRLLRNLGVPLTVEQRQVVYLGIERNPENFQPDRLPIWIDAEELTYGFPSDGRVPGVKLASHVLGASFDPNREDRPLIPEDLDVVKAYAERRFPDLNQNVQMATACLYTMTPDENFIVDTVPGMPNVTLVSGCSGHGFKFTVLLGKIAAMMTTGGRYPWDLSPWRLARFGN
jgi:monomeric sarcosine oxidase